MTNYKEILGRYFYIQEESGKAEITFGVPENHVHVALNKKEALKLKEWLFLYIKRSAKK